MSLYIIQRSLGLAWCVDWDFATNLICVAIQAGHGYSASRLTLCRLELVQCTDHSSFIVTVLHFTMNIPDRMPTFIHIHGRLSMRFLCDQFDWLVDLFI